MIIHDIHIVEDDPVKFEMMLPGFSFEMGAGDNLGFRLSYSWEDADGQLPFSGPDNLKLVYGSMNHDSNGNISVGKLLCQAC